MLEFAHTSAQFSLVVEEVAREVYALLNELKPHLAAPETEPPVTRAVQAPQLKPPAFLCYSRTDSPAVLQLARDLKRRGAGIWLDQLDIRPGRKWDREIEDALRQCRAVVVVLSEAAVQSENVLDEIAFAIDERKVLIPVLLQSCQIPLRLRRVQHVDFRDSYDAGVERLSEILNG